MQWFRNESITNTDAYIKDSIYSGIPTQGEGIDLRQEMYWILYGKNTAPVRKPKGHWIIYRRFDRTQKSSNYSNRTHEGIGGPAYIYTDSILRTRRVPLDKKNTSIEQKKSFNDIDDKYLYYFEYTVIPRLGDQIFEIVWDDHMITPTIVTDLTMTERYTISRVHDYRLEGGNVQYYIASAELDEVRY